jgi:hypothetical protein
MQSDMGMGPQGFMDGMMDSGMGQMDAQSDLATPSPSFGNRQGPGTPMMDMAVQPPRNMEDMNRIYAVSMSSAGRASQASRASSEVASLSVRDNVNAISLVKCTMGHDETGQKDARGRRDGRP